MRNMNIQQPKKVPTLYRNIGNAANKPAIPSLLPSSRQVKPLISREHRDRENERHFKEVSLNKNQQYDRQLRYHSNMVTTTTKIVKDTSSVSSNKNNVNNMNVEHGISINVNIQNLITPKQLLAMQACGLQRDCSVQKIHYQPSNNNNNTVNNNQSKKSRKPSIVVKTQAADTQFQCNEQLGFVKSNNKTATRTRPVLVDPKFKDLKNVWTKNYKQPKNTKILNHQELIAKFQVQIQNLNDAISAQNLQYLGNRQQGYFVDPTYIQKCQPNFNWKMRAQMIQWMMQVSYEYSLKRQTFHISVNLVDRYLMKQKNVPKVDFQLIGAAAMFIASKLQQFQPKSSQDFVRTTGRAISTTKLKQMQRKICTTLQYQLNPPTLYRWANRLMIQWDNYLKYCPQAQRHHMWAFAQKIYFKECDDTSYINFRVLVQLIDCSYLDIKTAQYNPKLLVCGFLYLYLGRQTKFFTNRDIVNTFTQTSLFLFQQQNYFNDLFNQFLNFSFGLPLADLLPTIQYCASYFLLPANVDTPAPKSQPDAYQNMELQEYCSFQTFDRNMYPIVNKRVRDVYV